MGWVWRSKEGGCCCAGNYLKWVCVFTTVGGGMLDTHLHHFLLWILNRIDVASFFGYELTWCCSNANRSESILRFPVDQSAWECRRTPAMRKRIMEWREGERGSKGKTSLYFRFPSDSHADLECWELCEHDISHICNDYAKYSLAQNPEGCFSELTAIYVQPADIGWPTGNGKKLSCRQACCLSQLCLAAA